MFALVPRATRRRLRRVGLALASMASVGLVASWMYSPGMRALSCDASPADIAARLKAAEADGYWHVGFVLGEELGAACGELGAAVAHASAVPSPLQSQFFDGLGHGFLPALDDLPGAVADIHRLVPAEHQLALTDGLALHLALHHLGQSGPVFAALSELQILGVVPSQNGVRIGLQRALGDDLDTAIAVALQYPTDWQPALLEELGWRAGEDLSAEAALALSLGLEQTQRCAFSHGIMRGAWHASDDVDALLALVTPEDACRGAWLHATAWVLTEGGLTPLPDAGVFARQPSTEQAVLRRSAQQLASGTPMWTW